MSKVIYANLNRCIDCQACEVACQREHNDHASMSVLLVQDRFAVPLCCRHCANAPCVAACYAGALTSTTEGTVAFDRARCTGCGLCLFACPFGVIGFARPGKVMYKCDLCAERLERGSPPACVITCPTQALSYVDYEAFTQEVKRRAAAATVRAVDSSAGPWLM